MILHEWPYYVESSELWSLSVLESVMIPWIFRFCHAFASLNLPSFIFEFVRSAKPIKSKGSRIASWRECTTHTIGFHAGWPVKDFLPLCDQKALMGSLLTGVLLIGICHLSQCGNFLVTNGIACLERCKSFGSKWNKKEQNQESKRKLLRSMLLVMHILATISNYAHYPMPPLGKSCLHEGSDWQQKIAPFHRPKPTAPQCWSACSLNGAPCMGYFNANA